MASNRIDVTVNGKDNTAAAMNSASKNINKLEQDALKAGSTVGSAISKGVATARASLGTLGSAASSAGATIGSAISRGASVASSAISKLGSVASSAFGQIKAGAGAANDSLGGIGGAIGGLLGGFGLLQAGSAIVGGAMTKQFTQAELAMKVGNDRAKELSNTISQIVAATPGDDTYMNQLLGGMVAKEQSLSNDQLRTAGFLASDYIIKSRSVGKTMLETQMDLKEYLLTGNTGQLERDSILKMQLDTLKGQGTVGDRILALDKAMKAEGYEGLSQLDIMQIKWDTLKGKIQLAATTIGEKILPPLEKIVGWILKLDEKTGGWSSILFVAVGTIGLLALALGPVVAATISAWYAMKSYRIEAEKAAIAAGLIKPPLGPAGAAPTGIGQSIKNIIWSILPAAMTGWFVSGGGVAGMLSAITATVASWGATIATSLAMGFSAALGPAFLGLFQEGSLLSGSWDFWANWGPQADQIKKDFAGIGAYGAKTMKDLQTLWNATAGAAIWAGQQIYLAFANAGAYIQGAWSNTVAYIVGAWNNTVAYISGAWSNTVYYVLGLWNTLKSAVSRGVSATVNIFWGPIQTAINKFWELYYAVRNNPIVQRIITIASSGASAVSNVVHTVTNAATSAWNWLTGAKGPGDVKYQDYAGYTGKNPWQSDGTLAGNCVDMSMGLVGRYGGSLVNGTWNGGMHTWWRAPDGQEYDPARKALNNTWAPPTSRGPGDGNGTTYVFNAPIYGWDDFQKKVELANSNIITGTF